MCRTLPPLRRSDTGQRLERWPDLAMGIAANLSLAVLEEMWVIHQDGPRWCFTGIGTNRTGAVSTPAARS